MYYLYICACVWMCKFEHLWTYIVNRSCYPPFLLLFVHRLRSCVIRRMHILTVFHLAIEISDSQLLLLLVHAVQANNLKTCHILSFREDPVQTAFICTCTLSYVPLCGHIRYWQHHWSLVVSPSWDSPFHFKWLQERSVSSHWMQAWAMWFLHGNICLEVCRLDWNQGTPLCDWDSFVFIALNYIGAYLQRL